MKNLLCTLVLFLCGCFGCSSTLPAFAEPTSGEFDPASIKGKDLIAYREVTPADFLAEEPPDDLRPYAEKMGALTCTNVFTFPDPQFVIEQTASEFRGKYANLDFVAAMDRECSWWNPKDGTAPRQYVLQHEQIHFALAESAARELNAQAKKLLAREFTAGSLEQVQQEMQEIVQEMMKHAIEDLLERNLDFDRDTSNKYAPEVQERWYREVMKELGQ